MAVGEDQVWTLAYHRNKSICHFSSWILSFLIQQQSEDRPVTDLLCEKVLQHTRTKCKWLPETELTHITHRGTVGLGDLGGLFQPSNDSIRHGRPQHLCGHQMYSSS